MKNQRIIAVINIVNNIAVQSIGFKKYLPLGKPNILIEFLNSWGVDEITILNIKASISENSLFRDSLKMMTKSAFVPIAAGGGIKSVNEVEKIIRGGADKVVINSYGILNPLLFKKSAIEFGNQAIVGSIDVKKINNRYIVFIHSGTVRTKYNLEEGIKILEDNYVGEILINSIDRDGTKTGFDENIVKLAKKNTTLPITICGGAGNFDHFRKILKYNLSGIAAGNFFNFTEQSVKNLKYFIKYKCSNNFIRFEDKPDNKSFDRDFRTSYKGDLLLEKLKYKRVSQEKI